MRRHTQTRIRDAHEGRSSKSCVRSVCVYNGGFMADTGVITAEWFGYYIDRACVYVCVC